MFGFKKNQETVYLGYSLEKLAQVREILELNGIEYSYDVKNRQGQLLSPGRGTVRGHLGSAGMDMDYERQYEVTVDRKDVAQAKFLLGELYQ